MESNQDLFRQAILDAKAVRDTAMAAARTTLAEHFEPFIKQTMQETISEEDDTMEEYADTQVHEKEAMHKVEEMDESSLDEILAELDALSEDLDVDAEESIEEGHVKSDGYDGKAGKGESGYDEKAKVSHGDHKLHEADDADEDAEEDDEAEEAGEDVTKDIEGAEDAVEGSDEQEIVDITVGELKDIIRDVFTQLQGGADDFGGEEDTLDADTDLAADLDVDGEEDSEEISLEEILASLQEDEDTMEEAAEVPGTIQTAAADVHKVEEIKKELNEAVKTIKALRTELNEMNLFSAKMLYVNKLFKAKNLTESQKTKVINAFDRATSVKEVENTYKTLQESVGESKKSSIKESVGFASKPIGSAPARPIVEADAFVSRWQQLAGII